MNELLKDFRYGLRMLYKTPGLSLVAIVTIALGVGAVTQNFSGFYGMLIRGLPFEDGDRLMSISETLVADGITSRSVPIHDYVAWREQQTAFEDLAAFLNSSINLADTEERPERYQGTFVTAGMFSEVNARPLMGRLFLEDEDAGHAPPTIILGYSVWRNRYHGDPNIIGNTVRANGIATTIIGVMPEGFRFPFDNDLWVPLAIDPAEVPRGQGARVWVIGRLKRNVSLEQSLAQMAGIAQRLATEYPETNNGVGASVQPYVDQFMPTELVAMTWISMAAVFGVLIISCLNVANLLLARAAARVKEMAIRSALGASRGRVIRQLMVEATILALIGGVAGMLIAATLIDMFNSLIAEGIEKPYWMEFRSDAPILLFAVAMTLVASVASGIIPAFKASGIDVHELLKDESAGSSSFRMGRVGTSLVVTEIAVSGALLVCRHDDQERDQPQDLRHGVPVGERAHRARGAFSGRLPGRREPAAILQRAGPAPERAAGRGISGVCRPSPRHGGRRMVVWGGRCPVHHRPGLSRGQPSQDDSRVLRHVRREAPRGTGLHASRSRRKSAGSHCEPKLRAPVLPSAVGGGQTVPPRAV